MREKRNLEGEKKPELRKIKHLKKIKKSDEEIWRWKKTNRENIKKEYKKEQEEKMTGTKLNQDKVQATTKSEVNKDKAHS